MSPDGSTVLFRALPPDLKFATADKRILQQFARALAKRIAGDRAFTCLVTNDRELHRLNRQFLGHDYATDVLSFPAGESNGNLGELAISIERAEVQASEFGHSRLDEVRILMLHGLLHLIGLDHEKDRGEMARAERKWRAAFGLPVSLIARSRSGGRGRARERTVQP
ncbi:MAG: rRNA maturation RNase YbeY [Acidobacteriaceae bacterium]|nr:rRNA maturation RNase YbeY [Acidobacteriaceae bacterium]